MKADDFLFLVAVGVLVVALVRMWRAAPSAPRTYYAGNG